jgi:homoserine dehydrogenase
VRAPFRIGLIGLGNVGGALARRLTEDAEPIEAAAGRPITVEAIAVRKREGRQAPALLVDADALVQRPGLDAVVEVIGGLEPAHTYIKAALQAGREVITANKQVIAKYGPALARLGPLRFEASVASAIPIVETLAETLRADRITALTGILNGTTNFMLDVMTRGAGYDEALDQAQRLGMAEADPTADVDGHDAAAKLAILSMLAFRRRIDPDRIERVGIRRLTGPSLNRAATSGGVIKLIAAARRITSELIECDVRPRMVPGDSFFAQVSGGLNGITVDAHYAGTLTLSGAGAGPDAAASGVVADLIRSARGARASAGEVLAQLAAQQPAHLQPLTKTQPFAAAE